MPRKSLRLNVQALEAREVPANINIVSAGGIVTLTGDADSNSFTLSNSGALVRVTADTGTTFSFNGTPNLAALDLPAANTIRMNLGAGDDLVHVKSNQDFKFAGTMSINLGEGDNTVDLTTTGKVELGKLSVVAGTGRDSLNIRGGSGQGSTVTGAISAQFGDGGSETVLSDLNCTSPAGMTLAAGKENDSLTANKVGVAGPIAANFGAGSGTISVYGGEVHRTKVTSGDTTFGYFTNMNVRDDVTLRGKTLQTQITDCPIWVGDFVGRAQLDNKALVTGNVDMGTAGVHPKIDLSGGAVALTIGDNSATTTYLKGLADIQLNGTESTLLSLGNGVLEANRVKLNSPKNARFEAQNAPATNNISRIASDFSINANAVGVVIYAPLEVAGKATVKAVLLGVDINGMGTLKVGQSFNLSATDLYTNFRGVPLNVLGDLNIRASRAIQMNWITQSDGHVGGNVNVIGGTAEDAIAISGTFAFDKSVNFNLGGGNNSLRLSKSISIAGDLSYQTGGGNDLFGANGVAVAGKSNIATGAGGDTVEIDASTWGGTFALDVGAGSDSIAFGYAVGQANAVTFQNDVKVKGGSGDDKLLLGKAQAATGDTYSKVIFLGTNSFDGGSGTNQFNETTGQYVGLTPVKW